MRRPLKIVLWLLVVCGLVLLAIQLVPYGRAHENPPVTGTPAWDSPRTEELVRTACYDCHSNEVVWPWYSNVAPASWLVTYDVDGARAALNFSEWDASPEVAALFAAEIEDVVREGEMPPLQYRVAHSGARLSEAEREELIAGVRASLAP